MPNLNPKDFIAKYGAQAALAASVPEIMDKLKEAIARGWTEDEFIAAIRNTRWYSSGAGENWRLAETAKAADSTEYAASIKKAIETLKLRATKLGFVLDDATASSLAETLLHEYWGRGIPTDVMDSRLGSFASVSKIVGGSAMSTRDSLSSFAASMGVKFDPTYFDSAAKSIATGGSTIEQWNQAIKDAAKSRYPMFANQIDAGVTLEQIASPYKQTISSVLEIPYASIMLDDPLMGQAFGAVNKDGAPSVMSLWDFEKSLRNDPRWVYTKNARQQIDSTARKVLQDFGLAY